MAKSKYEYVKGFETDPVLLPNTWVVVRLDGRGFTKFSEAHKFTKPNDERALRLMNRCAQAVLAEFGDVVFAYGESDEYSFVLGRSAALYGRRTSKIVTSICSSFTAHYVFLWAQVMGPDTPLLAPPSFDGRAVCYPSLDNIRDYLSWRQADCHINNLYNTCFWALVHGGATAQEAHARLSRTVSGEKNELLFAQFRINYNELPPMFRKGTVLVRTAKGPAAAAEGEGGGSGKGKRVVLTLHDDIIGKAFWDHYDDVLL